MEEHNETARNALASLVLGQAEPGDRMLAQLLASVLATPLYAARYRNELVACLLEQSLQERAHHGTWESQ